MKAAQEVGTSLLLQALRRENRKRPPVWLMRQAGRYLPAYQRLRAQYSLRELFFTPELAAQVTKMPIDSFGVDAAILFSDITVVALALGLELEFCEGPVISPVVTPQTVLGDFPERLYPIFQAVQILKRDLSVPLIGFCGGPFTVATYLVGGLETAKIWMEKEPVSFTALLDAIAKVSCRYLKEQERSGVDAIQIFDSWANLLTPEQFRIFSLPYLKELIGAVDVPAIFFMRGAGAYVEEIPCAISLDWTTPPCAARRKTDQPLQGNLSPDLLFEPISMVRQKTAELLASMQGDPAFIVNLGHGVKPKTPVEAVRALVDTVQQASS